MFKKIFISLMLAVSFSMTASATDWSELIGKELVLYRWGELRDNCFSWIRTTNPAGERPVERMVLTDATHLVWKYSLDGDFTRECSIEGEVLTLKEPLFDNEHLRIVECDGEVLLISGEDKLTRAFSILNPKPEPSQLPASVGSKKGFCDGKLDDLLPYITDVTYSSRTPMGRNFLYHRQASPEDKAWLESTKEVFNEVKGQIKAFGVNLFPNGKPVLADVHQKSINDCNAMSVLANMAFLYPEFIKSIIHQEAADSFRVDMFDPEGKPIVVCVSNRFPVRKGGYPVFCVGEDDTYCWISIMEKAAMKWIKVYNHINNSIEGCNAEWITPMFTGDGRSFCIQPGRLGSKDLARMINICLENGLMVNGGFLKRDIPLDGHKTISQHGHTFLPPQRKGALYAIRNPWGNIPNNHIMNVMSDNTVIPPLIDIRVISPGAAAKFFDKKAIKPETAITKTEKLFPSNWRNTQTGDWEIGFFNEFAIYDCQFWNYKQKQQKDGKYTFVLENNGKEVTVNVGKQEKNIRRIEIAGKKANYDIINTPTLPDYPTKDTRTGFVDNGYKTDTVTFVGWLKDMPEWAWNEGREFKVEVCNFLKDEEENISSKMDSLGRFSLKIPVLNTSEAYLDWGRVTKATPLEPGKTYFLFKDFKTDQILWMGDDVRVQNERLAHRCEWNMPRPDYNLEGHLNEMELLAQTDSARTAAMALIDEVVKAYPNLSQRYIDYERDYCRTCQGESLMQARFFTKNRNLSQEYMDYVGKELWRKVPKPYTLSRNFSTMMRDYLAHITSKRERDDAENYLKVIRSLQQQGMVTLTDEEEQTLQQYIPMLKKLQATIRTLNDRKEITALVNEFNDKEVVKKMDTLAKRIDEHATKEMAALYLREDLSVLDSVGSDQHLRDIYLARRLYRMIDGSRKPLDPAILEYAEKTIQMPAALTTIKTLNDKYLAIQQKDISKSPSLKSAEDVANMSDGEQMLRKIIEPYKGKIILLDVWGTWCSPCKEALSHSQEEYERLKDYDLVYLYLANDSKDDSWKNVIKEYNVVGDNVVHYNLPRAQQSAIENFLNVHGFPTYKLIDREGNVLDVNADPRDLEGLASLLDKLK